MHARVKGIPGGKGTNCGAEVIHDAVIAADAADAADGGSAWPKAMASRIRFGIPGNCWRAAFAFRLKCRPKKTPTAVCRAGSIITFPMKKLCEERC